MFKDIRHAAAVFQAKLSKKSLVDAGPKIQVKPGDEDPLARRLRLISEFTPVAMRVCISVIVLISGLAILICVKDQSLQKIASGLIGTIVGFWLR